METFLYVFKGVLYGMHILVCVVMILAILLQAGRSAGIGSALGGGSSQSLFGASGGQGFLAKFTTAAAIVFMLTSVGLAKFSTPTESRFERKAKALQDKLKPDKGEEVNLEKLGVSVPAESKAKEAEGVAPAEPPATEPPAGLEPPAPAGLEPTAPTEPAPPSEPAPPAETPTAP